MFYPQSEDARWNIFISQRGLAGVLDVVMEVGEKWCEEEQMEALAGAGPRPRRGEVLFSLLSFFPSIPRSGRDSISLIMVINRPFGRPSNLPYTDPSIHPPALSSPLLIYPKAHIRNRVNRVLTFHPQCADYCTVSRITYCPREVICRHECTLSSHSTVTVTTAFLMWLQCQRSYIMNGTS